MISAEDFLSILEQNILLPEKMIAELRTQVAKSPKPVSALSIAGALIEKGYLTKHLAEQMLIAPGAETYQAEDEDLQFASENSEKPNNNNNDIEEDWQLEVVEDMSENSAAVSAKPPEMQQTIKSILDDAETAQVATEDSVFDISTPSENGIPALKRHKGFWAKLSTRNRRRKDNVWDSSLLLLGGGALAVLLILAFALIVFFMRTSSETMIAAADASYKDGAYTIAISQYDEFLKKFPHHQQASGARVRRGLAMIRNATEIGGDYAKSLEIATQVLGEISTEDNFGTARGELRSLLPTIAEGLCRQAHEKTSAEDVDRTRSALRLVDKYIPKSQQPATRLDDIRSLLAVTEMRLARDDELARTTAEIYAAIEQGNTSSAYTAHHGLLKMYPELLDNAKLDELMRAVAKAEKQAVKFIAVEKKAFRSTASDDETAISLVLRLLEKKVPRAKGNIFFAVAEGAAYALNAEDGTVFWRREVGFGGGSSRPAPLPMRVAPRPDSDVLLVDAKARSLLRLDAATGKVRWQQVIGEEFAASPVIDGSRVLVATRSGRLVIIDLDSGNSPGYIQLPQELTTAPLVDNKRGQIYQVADHSNLYVLSATDLKCEDVIHIGHATGEIAVSPVVVAAYLVLAENRGSDNVALRVLSLDAEEQSPSPFLLQQELTLKGHVDTTPLACGPQILVSTDRGRVYALRVSSYSSAQPLEKVGQIQTGEAANLVRYLLLVGKQFWIADDHLSKFEIQTSLSNLKSEWSTFKDSVFLQPLVADGSCIFSVRRRVGLPGVIVAAVDINRPEIFWQTHLAVGPATAAVVDKARNQARIVTSLGSVFEIEAEQFTSTGKHVLDRPLVALRAQEVVRPIDSVTYMPDGLIALCNGRRSERLDVFDPVSVPKQFRPLILPDTLSAPPISFARGLLVLCRVGQIFVLDPRRGGNLVEPFQPVLEGGKHIDWLPPLDAGEQSVLISDGRTIYRLGVRQRPKPHLAALDKVELNADMASPLAIVGETAFAVDETGNLRPFSLPKLTAGQPIPLGARCIWGPCAAGKNLLLADELEQLQCFDAAGRRKWQSDLIHGRPVGKPLATEDKLIFASTEGVVWRVDAETGHELANCKTGHALAAGPVVFDGRLLLCGHDGTLYLIDQPK